MSLFIKIFLFMLWSILLCVASCTIGHTQGKSMSNIFTPPAPPTKYETLLKREVITIKDEKGDSYILKRCEYAQSMRRYTYNIFPATEAEMKSEKK